MKESTKNLIDWSQLSQEQKENLMKVWMEGQKFTLTDPMQED